MARTRYVELHQGRLDHRWYWRLVDANGERHPASQGYVTETWARRMATRAHPGLEIRLMP